MPTILLSDLLDHPVRSDGRRVGFVTDVRLKILLEGRGSRPETVEVVGLLVSPRRRHSYLGYERTGVNSPWPIAHLARRLHRGTVLVPWRDVVAMADEIELRAGYETRSAMLDVDRLKAPDSNE